MKYTIYSPYITPLSRCGDPTVPVVFFPRSWSRKARSKIQLTKVDMSDMSWCPRVFSMELSCQSWCIDLLPGFPTRLFYAISFPFDLVLKSIPEKTTIKDFFHLPFLFTINDFWWWRWFWSSSWNRIFFYQG